MGICFWVFREEIWAERLYFKVIGLGEIYSHFCGALFNHVYLPRDKLCAYRILFLNRTLFKKIRQNFGSTNMILYVHIFFHISGLYSDC